MTSFLGLARTWVDDKMGDLITLRGEPVAVIKPFSKEVGRVRQTQLEEALKILDALAERTAQSWCSPKSALELLEEQRQ